MWPDNDTNIDFLNFGSVADTVGELVIQADGRPISIGISGAWGTGKSSLIRLGRLALERRGETAHRKFVFVEFNAWLYQGYDDARAALVEIIAEALRNAAEGNEGALTKATELLGRVNWLRVAKLTAGSAAALAVGLSPIGLLGEIYRFGREAVVGGVDEGSIKEGEELVAKAAETGSGLIKPKKQEKSPPKEIQALRDAFEETLKALGATLVVLIDDLDRCLPETTISTLEAIRLFLFLKNTAFIIAADNEMIKHAVRKHFEGLGEDQLISYFDKLIQVPIRVPPLGTQEVRAYMMLLFVENAKLAAQESDDQADKEKIRKAVCTQLGESWKGKRVDRAFMVKLKGDFPADLVAKFDAADRLAPLMTTTAGIAGNPRLIKRFLNALAIRMALSDAHGIGIDEAVLAKMLLFERCGNASAYAQLIKAVSDDDEGKPRFLSDWEDKAVSGDEYGLPPEWDDQFVREWLTVPPKLADRDLRGVLYVSREHAPIITPQDRLSSEGAALLQALIEHPDMASSIQAEVGKLPRTELSLVFDRVLDRARQMQEWGVPTILDACMVLARTDSTLGDRLAAFLIDRPEQQITPAIVPKISGESWAQKVFAAWSKGKVSPPVKAAITKKQNSGNI